MAKTKSKQRKIGTELFINQETGVVSEFAVVQEESDTDYNFQKIWVDDLVNILRALGGSKVDVFCYFLENKNVDNKVIGSANDISNKLNISVSTVKETIKIMKKLNYLKMQKNAVYQVSPDLIVRGRSTKRQKLLSEYNKIPVNSDEVQKEAS